MALTIDKSMDISDFWECLQHITALVESEYKAVEGMEGFYELHLDLVWDCEDGDEVEDDLG